jgi:hypothetical protein
MNLRIQSAIRPFRDHWTRTQVLSFSQAPGVVPPLLPPKYLFDFIADAIHESSKPFSAVRKQYQRRRPTLENLTARTMTAGQRHFVQKIWQPIILPQLVAAGFWRIASVA